MTTPDFSIIPTTEEEAERFAEAVQVSRFLAHSMLDAVLAAVPD